MPYYKYILLLLANLAFSYNISYAQHRKTESSDYKNAKKTVEMLYTVSDANRAKAIDSADSLISAGEAVNGNYLISCLGYQLKAKMLYRMSKIEDALSVISKWKNLAYNNKDYEEYFNAYYNYCDYQQDINSAKALVQGQKMITEAKQLKYLPGIAWAHEMQGNLSLYILQDYPTSTYHFRSAIDIAEKLHGSAGPELGRLYFRLASSLVEEHKSAESEKAIETLRKYYGSNLPAEKELRILIIQLDNAYNSKADAKSYTEKYQKVLHHKLYESVYVYDTRLFYKVRWLIRTGQTKEALAEIPHLAIALDRAMLRADAFEVMGDWHKACTMKDSIESVKDSMMHELRSEELVELDAEMKNTELSIESAENKTRFQYVLFSSLTVFLCFLFAILGYIYYRRRRSKLEEDRVLFVRNITHQLRTPMTVVTGMVEQLKEHIPANDSIGIENVEATKRQSRKLQDLIMQLARMSKTGMPPFINEQGDISTLSAFSINTQHNKVIPTLPTDTDKPSILLAEDTDDVAMMMCNMLSKQGYAVTRAVDGQEALDIMQHDLPDLLITDVAMPRMDGLELMRRIRNDETMCHLPIIVASARVEDSERMEGISAGAEVYLTKPFIPDELLLNISTMLEQRKRLRRSFSFNTNDNLNVNNDSNIDNDTEANHIHNNIDDNTDVITPELSKSEKKFLAEINKHIDDNLITGNVNPNFIADKMSTSVSTINRKIKNITGMPFATYIRTRRLHNAQKLLLTTDKSISEIEVLCGFFTPGHLSRLFKAETGMTPREYRDNR